MKKVYVWLLINFCVLSAGAQYFEWAKKGGLWAYDYGYGITTDKAGRIYVAGKYEQNANFSGTVVSCQGNHDIYLAQYSPSGNLNWIRTAGGYTGDYATCVATDGSNYVYIGGEIEGSGATIKFSGSSITLKCEGSNDIMLAKYTLNGTLVWARRAGGPYYEKALGIALDPWGNVYACGLFNKYAKFGNTTVYGRGGNDIWIAKYSANGNLLWVRTAGSSGRDEAKGIVCDASGNAYITGLYKNGCKFGSQYLYSPNGYFNCFVAKYSPSGSLQWVKTGGGNYDDVGWGITKDASGLLYIGGEFNATASFSSKTIWTSGSADIFVACYDQGGNIRWITKAGGKGSDRARGIGYGSGKIYLTGQYGSGGAKFGSIYKSSADHWDIFVAAMSTSGSFQWVLTAGGSADPPEDLGYESGNTICGDAYGNAFASGAMLGGATFGSTSLSRYSRTDMFVCKVKGSSSDADAAACPPPDFITIGTPAPVTMNDTAVQLTAYPEGGIFTGPGIVDNKFYPKLTGPGEFEIRYHFEDDNGCGGETSTIIVVKEKTMLAYLAPDESLAIFPNPSSGIFDVKVRDVNEETDLVIYNLAGQIIEARKIIGPAQINFDFTEKEKGIYFITVTSGDAVLQKKVIIQ